MLSNKFKLSLISSMLLASFSFASLAAEVPAGVELAEKQHITRNAGTEPASLDPHKVDGVPEMTILNDLMDTLVSTSAIDGKTIPGVAESWQSADFKTWIFHIRPTAKWSNGDPLTAHDFEYSLKRLADPKTLSPYASYILDAQIENGSDIINSKLPADQLGVKALDDHTLQVTLSVPLPYFPNMLSHTSMKPVHQKTVEQFGDKWTQPQNWVGNGAYRLKQWVVNERIVLERNPHYWNNDKTVIEQVTFLPIASEVTDVNRYRAGEVDMTAYKLPIELFQKIKQEFASQLHQSPYLCTYYYEMNNQKAPFDNVNVRSALKLALDQDLMTNTIKNQGDTTAYTFTPPHIQGGELIEKPDWATLPQQQRNEQAIKLLSEAGYSKQNPLKFELLYNTSDIHKKMAIAASAIWKKNLDGMVEVQMVNQEWKTFLDTRRLGNQQMARAGWCADYNDASSFLNMLLSTGTNNHPHYKSEAYDNLVQQALQAESNEERMALYAKAQAQADADSVIVPVFHQSISRLVKPWVGGYTGNNPLDNVYSKDLYIIKH